MENPVKSSLIASPGGYVDGRWIRGGRQTFDVTNPATGDLLASLPAMGARQTNVAISAAARAMNRPAAPVEVRQEWLRGIVAALREHREDLARIITLEQGKPLEEARTEVDYGAGFFAYFAEHLSLLAPRPLEQEIRGCRWTVHHRPLGVAGLIVPWNFPLAMLAKKLAAALASGCAVVVKPAELTPLTSVALWRLLERLDLPRGQANLLTGPPAAIGRALCRSHDVRMLSFTGSTAVGQLLARQSSGTVKRLALELGGNAPFLVFDDAEVEAAADALIASKFRCVGQTCVSVNRVFAQHGIHDAFRDAVAERVRGLKMGDGMDPETRIGPLINREGFRKVSRHVRDALDRGARLVTGGVPSEPEQDWGFFFPPSVLEGVSPEMLAFREETFGPVVSIGRFADEAGAVTAANGTPYGLAAYVFTADAGRAERLAASLSFGHVAVNSGTGPIPEAPFGGYKQSGYGREGGAEGLLEYCEVQTVARRAGL